MCKCIHYTRATPSRGLVLKLSDIWDGNSKNFKFNIHGKSDSNYVTDPENMRHIMVTGVYLSDVPNMFTSVTQTSDVVLN